MEFQGTPPYGGQRGASYRQIGRVDAAAVGTKRGRILGIARRILASPQTREIDEVVKLASNKMKLVPSAGFEPATLRLGGDGIKHSNMLVALKETHSGILPICSPYAGVLDGVLQEA